MYYHPVEKVKSPCPSQHVRLLHVTLHFNKEQMCCRDTCTHKGVCSCFFFFYSFGGFSCITKNTPLSESILLVNSSCISAHLVLSECTPLWTNLPACPWTDEMYETISKTHFFSSLICDSGKNTAQQLSQEGDLDPDVVLAFFFLFLSNWELPSCIVQRHVSIL